MSATAAESHGGIVAVPLAHRSVPTGKTMFTAIPAEQAGVVALNAYDDPKMWGERDQEFVLGSMGTGVAIGDYDNDGRPDIFAVCKTGQCRLFRNLGNWKFQDVTESAGLEMSGGGWLNRARSLVGGGDADEKSIWKQGVSFADVNNDGWLDIYVCRYNAPNLLYVNQRDGTFKEEAAQRGLAIVDASAMGAFCDYDRDGWLDVYVQTNMLDHTSHPTGQRDYLLHNNGDGTFTDVTQRAGIEGETLAHSTTWWDYDGDGWPDVYIANDFAGADRLYHNNHDGTFTNVLAQVVPHAAYSSMGADLGDINNDGRIDFVVGDMAATTHEKDQRGMATSRQQNGAQAKPTDAPQYPRNAVYLNTGTGRMLEVAYLVGLAATDWTWSMRLEDLDNDGRLDLHVTNGMSREYQNADLRQRSIFADSLEERRKIMYNSPPLRERHLAFRNLGDLQFEDTSTAWGLDQVGVSFGAAFGDLDGDGDLDLVYANFDAGLTVLRNDCQTGHRLLVDLRGTRSNRFGIGAVVRIETKSGVQVRQLTLARGYLSCSEPVVHFGLGDDALIDRLTVAWPSGFVQSFEQVAADQRITITEPKEEAGSSKREGGALAGPPQLFEPLGGRLAIPSREVDAEEKNVQPLLPVRFARRGPALAVTQDDRGLALVVGGTSGDPAARRIAVKGTVIGALDPLPGTDTALPDGPVLAFDADGDGADDILITKAGSAQPAGSAAYQPHLLLAGSGGRFHEAPADALPKLSISAGAACAADFDRNGTLDVFIGGRVEPGHYPQAPRSALLINHGGRFEDATVTLAPGLVNVGLVTAAVWSDVDGDGWVDLVIATEWGPVRYFHNEHGRGLADWTDRAGFASAGAGWWTSLATGDLNNDGRPDFVVGNVGLNTQYHATPAEPALLYAGAFGRPNETVLIEAYYERGKVYPWRTRNELGARIPRLMQRYQRNDSYARATLDDMIGANALASAQRFAATELRSGVFLSQPDGTYRFSALPRIAQVSPLQGVQVLDVNGDGQADIVAVQNSYAADPTVGHFDGGLGQVLLGDGAGHFTAIEPVASGFIVPGDAKALVAIDLNDDGWPDFVATRNNASSLAFSNRGRPEGHPLRIDLREDAPNRNAIGARVVVEYADGSRRMAEVTAGAGYYSQSQPACFFGWQQGNPPRTATVRWPDGGSSQHGLAPGENVVTIRRSH